MTPGVGIGGELKPKRTNRGVPTMELVGEHSELSEDKKLLQYVHLHSLYPILTLRPASQVIPTSELDSCSHFANGRSDDLPMQVYSTKAGPCGVPDGTILKSSLAVPKRLPGTSAYVHGLLH